MRTYFAYIRVSTIKQGEKGSSLQEQRDAITRYAAKHELPVAEWFEEQVTAAKQGRPLFKRMMARLKRGHAHGVIIHKVDRSARNLADWAELAALMDSGTDVHFAHEAMDLQTRGGRLSADIQAVVAADFIRNLRDEVKKGMYGRLKQGFYPFRAPPGYQDTGKGQLKTVDPMQGPLVRLAFERYASGSYPIVALAELLCSRGLTNRCGTRVPANQMARLLANPFYYGLIRVNGHTYIGKHEPLISKALFDRCRDIAEGRTQWRTPARIQTDRIFRRMIKCSGCNRNLTGETQKGHNYYRCHSQSCSRVCVREDRILEAISQQLTRLPEIDEFAVAYDEMRSANNIHHTERVEAERAACQMTRGNLQTRKRKLVDAFVDGLIEQSIYEERLVSLNDEMLALAERESDLAKSITEHQRAQDQKFELLKALKNMAHLEKTSENASKPAEIREIIKRATSNLVAHEKTIALQWIPAVQALLETPSPYMVRQPD